MTPFPFRGNGYVMWDFGTPPPPTSNNPNREGKDPHGSGGGEPRVIEMATTFVKTGELDDVCQAAPCTTP